MADPIEFKRAKQEPPPGEKIPCALHRVTMHVAFNCLCQDPPTLMAILGPDHTVECPHCHREYYLDFAYFNRDDPKTGGNLGVSIRWRQAAGIVKPSTS